MSKAGTLAPTEVSAVEIGRLAQMRTERKAKQIVCKLEAQLVKAENNFKENNNSPKSFAQIQRLIPAIKSWTVVAEKPIAEEQNSGGAKSVEFTEKNKRFTKKTLLFLCFHLLFAGVILFIVVKFVEARNLKKEIDFLKNKIKINESVVKN